MHTFAYHYRMQERVMVYIDGFNLYYGMLARFGSRQGYKWLDLMEVSKKFLRNGQKLIGVKYFSARVSSPNKANRQAVYLQALAATGLDIYYGKFQIKRVKDCSICHSSFSCSCPRAYQTFEEKMTDVNIAVHAVVDAYEDKYDKAVVISGDSDLTPPIRAIISKGKKVIAYFPPRRVSNELRNVATTSTHLSATTILNSQLAIGLVNSSGYPLGKPTSW